MCWTPKSCRAVSLGWGRGVKTCGVRTQSLGGKGEGGGGVALSYVHVGFDICFSV